MKLPPGYISLSEAARRLHVSRQWLYEHYISRAGLPVCHFPNGVPAVSVEALERWQASYQSPKTGRPVKQTEHKESIIQWSECIPFYEEGMREPIAYYVKGHIDLAVFAAAIPSDVQHNYPPRHEYWRHLPIAWQKDCYITSVNQRKGMGAFPVTVVYV